jgi:hypothetical protein
MKVEERKVTRWINLQSMPFTDTKNFYKSFIVIYKTSLKNKFSRTPLILSSNILHLTTGCTTAGIIHIVPYNNGETVDKTSEDGEQNFH